MKDHVFAGETSTTRWRRPPPAWACRRRQLRYVVLDAGRRGRPRPRAARRRGSPSCSSAARRRARAGRRRPRRDGRRRPTAPRRAYVRGRSGPGARAGAGRGLDAARRRSRRPDEALVVRLEGAGPRAAASRTEGEVLQALEHLLQRLYRRASSSRAACVVDCEGYRERRDERCASEALGAGRRRWRADGRGPDAAAAQLLRAAGRAHDRCSEQPGVRTFSVGEGAERRRDRRAAGRPAGPAGAEPMARRVSTAQPLEALGLPRRPALRGSPRYLDLLAAWSPRVNLTGARTAGRARRLLVAAVAAGGRPPRRGA